MSTDAPTRPVTPTETLGPSLVPVQAPSGPLLDSTATLSGSPEKRKRPREDEEENTESPKRVCLSSKPRVCVYCRLPPVGEEDLVAQDDKENCHTSGPAPTTSAPATPPLEPFPLNNTGQPAASPTVHTWPMCKSARSKPVLAKESYKGVLRPQPFRRFPTTKNAERIALRNNLRDIYVGSKAQPTNVRYARDAPPRPRPRGTHASNAAHRGPLSQPVPQKKYQYIFKPYSYAEDEASLPPGPVDPALFLGTRQPGSDSDWTKDTKELAFKEPLRARGRPVHIPTFWIRSKRHRYPQTIWPSPMARDDWETMVKAWRVMRWKHREERARAARARKGPKPAKPVSRRRGPGGKPGPVVSFPLVPSKLGKELWRWSAEGSGGDVDEC